MKYNKKKYNNNNNTRIASTDMLFVFRGRIYFALPNKIN